MAHALPLKSAVNVLSELLSSNPDLQRLYLTTKREDGGRVSTWEMLGGSMGGT